MIYEAHVRGFTRLHPGVPPALRGTYAGLAHPAAMAELQKLGITAIELLPVFEFRDEEHLRTQGRHNYWGYNTVAFAPRKAAYAAAAARRPGGRVPRDGRALHDAGMEVILDVVFNHTGEGDDRGPPVAPRPRQRRHLLPTTTNLSGCGNTLNCDHPLVQRAAARLPALLGGGMHVDGLRFDLARQLGRDDKGYDWSAARCSR